MARNGFKGEIKANIKPLKIDLIDRKLIYLLSENARYSFTALSKALKTSREVIAYRIKRLENENFLHGFFTLIDTQKLGMQHHILYIKFHRTENKKNIIKKLEDNLKITRLKEVAGKYDLQVIFSTQNVEELDGELETLFSDFGQIIKEHLLMQIVEENFVGIDLILPDKDKIIIKENKGMSFQNQFFKRIHKTKNVELDDKDKQILSLLEHDSRIKITDISNQIKLSSTSIEARIKKIVSEGVIVSMYPLFSMSQLGYQWYKVFFQVRNLNKEHFIEYLKMHDNVLWYMKLLGKWNYQFSIFAKNNIEFYQILDDIRNEFSENILEHDSLIVIDQKKFTHRFD